MSLLANAVYANPTTPCWEPDTTGGGLNPTFDTVTFNAGAPILSERVAIGENVYSGASQVAVFNANANTLGPLQVGGVLEVQSGSALPTDTLPRMLYQGSGITYQQASTGTSFPLAVFSAGPPPTADLSNVRVINSASGTLGIPATIQATTYSANIAGTQVVQPKVQYGTVATSGTSGSTTITLPQAYLSSSSYVALPAMEDTNASQVSASRTSSNTFDVYWASASGGAHTIAWATFGL